MPGCLSPLLNRDAQDRSPENSQEWSANAGIAVERRRIYPEEMQGRKTLRNVINPMRLGFDV